MEVGKTALSKSTVRNSPSYYCGMNNIDALSHFLYGTVHGASDLMIFIPSEHSQFRMEYNYDIKVPSNGNNISIAWPKVDKSGSYVYERMPDHTVISPELKFNSDISRSCMSIKSTNSMFSASNASSVLGQFVKLSNSDGEDGFDLVITTSVEGISTRMVMSVPQKDGESTYVTGHSTMLSEAKGQKYTLSDPLLMNTLLSLFVVLERHPEDHDWILSYVATMLNSYIRSQLPNESNVKILGINLKMHVTKTNNCWSSSFNLFDKLVKRGRIVPYTPLQLMFYSLGQNDNHATHINLLDKWIDTISWSALINRGANSEVVLGLTPETTAKYRELFTSISMDNNRLRSDYYTPSSSIANVNKNVSKIDYDQFIREILIRTLSGDAIPESYPLFTRGKWYNDNATSGYFTCTHLHPFAKFALRNNAYATINSLVDDLLLNEEDNTKPVFLKSHIRLMDEMSSIIDRYVEK